jgi:heavy metal sensor kinase
MRHVFQSVRWRLQLWHALILLAVVAVLCLFAYRMAADERHRRIDHDLESFEHSFMRHMWEHNPDDKSDAPPTSEEIRRRFSALQDASDFPVGMKGLFDPASSESTYLAVWDGEGQVLFRSANSPARLIFPGYPDPESPPGRTAPGNYRELLHGGPKGIRAVVGRDISSDLAALNTLRWKIAGGGAVLWLLGLLGGWWLSGRAIRPVEEISRTASRIAEGDVSERINLANTDSELGRLSQVLNDTFDRLESSIRHQRQFTADASHELRTPLTVILSETSRGMKRDRDATEYREILSNCNHAAMRMRALVESLLILARQDGNHEAPVVEVFNLSSLVQDAGKLLQPLAEQNGTALSMTLEPVRYAGDSRSISMVAVNLVSNAIDHQGPGGKVEVRVFSRDGQAVMEVADQGPGIAPQHLPRLFDRFYRVDAARGPATGHSGLGLAIAKAIVDNHRGTIEVESSVGQGALFRVKLPLAVEPGEKVPV